MFELRTAGPKGLGLFASRHIPRGTRILSEAPLLSLKHTQDASHLFQNFHNQLSEKQRNELLNLSFFPGKGLLERSGRWASVVSWTLQDIMNSKYRVGGGGGRERRFLDLMRENARVLNVWRSNSFRLGKTDATFFERGGTEGKGGEGEGDGYAMSLFSTVARINHSCIPNSQANFLPSFPTSPSSPSSPPRISPSTISTPPPSPHSPQPAPSIGTFNIHALRDIAPNEELSISYLPEHGSLRSARQQKLEPGYGFLCDCPACDLSSPISQLHEKNRRILQERLSAFAALQAAHYRDSSGAGDEDIETWEYTSDGERLTPPPPPSSPAKNKNNASFLSLTSVNETEKENLKVEITLTQDFINMLESQGISGREIATMYYTLAKLLLRDGRQTEAFENAERGLDIDGCCLGKDHPLYKEAADFVSTFKV